MEGNLLLSLALVNSACKRALCLSTASLRGCVAGAAMPFLAKRRSWAKSRPRGGESYIVSSLLGQSVLFKTWIVESYYLSFMTEKLGFLHNFFEDRTPF